MTSRSGLVGKAARRARRLTRHRFRAPKVRADVAAWAADRGFEVTPLQPAVHVHRDLPCTIEPVLPRRFSAIQDQLLPARSMVAVPDAVLHAPNGLVELPDRSLAVESVYSMLTLDQEAAFRERLPRPSCPRPGTYFSLVAPWTHGDAYYHWMHDALERLYGAIEVLPADTRFVVPPSFPEWRRESLRVLGITDDRIVPLAATGAMRVESLCFVPAIAKSGYSRPGADAWLRDQFFAAYGLAHGPGTRRLFLSRRHQPSRRLANEAEVEAMLAPYGFETVAPESLTLRDQVDLFRDAAVVVATHGSAFTNILFAPPGLRVVDLVEPRMEKYAYVFWSLAGALGQEYWYVSVEAATDGSSPDDTYVPPEKLTAVLAALGLD